MKQHEAHYKFALKLCGVDLWKRKLFLCFESCIDVSFTLAVLLNKMNITLTAINN